MVDRERFESLSEALDHFMLQMVPISFRVCLRTAYSTPC